MNKIYNLAIVDDHPIVIEGLKILLSNIESIKVVECFNSGKSLFEYYDLDKLDILLLDIFLPDSNGIDICLKVKKQYPKIIVLAMSSQSERSIIFQMIKNGASGYLLKSASLDEFRDCINKSTKGQMAFSNEVLIIIDQPNLGDLKTIPRLTLREREILQLIKKGKSTQEIADTLFLSFLTIQTHRRNMLIKFQVKNIIELMNFVSENGLL